MLCALVMPVFCMALSFQGSGQSHHGNDDACLTFARCWNGNPGPIARFNVRDCCSGREALILRANGPRRHKECAVIIPSYDIIVTADKQND